MTTIALPSVFPVLQFSMLQINNLRTFSSPYGSSENLIDLLNDCWKITLEVGISNLANAAVIEAFVNAQRGGVNTVDLYHWIRPTPRGTANGVFTLSAPASAGAESIAITGGGGQAGRTLLAGDVLGLTPMLLMVAANVTLDGSGNGVVFLTNRLRIAKVIGSAVIWNTPKAPFRLSGVPSVVYMGSQTSSMTMDYFEAITA